MPTITVRKLQIDLSQPFSHHWLGGDAFRTHFFNALSMSFPLGEQFFIDSVRAALPRINDPELRQQIQGFIGQEATHRYLHAQFNQRLFEQGLRYLIEPWVKWRIQSAAGFSVRSHLAITMAYEHYTAIFSDSALGHDLLRDAEEPLKTLWEWHAAEETEHKSVAFDTYQALGGGYLRRIAWYLYTSLLFFFDIVVQTGNNLWRDQQFFKVRTWWQGLRYLCGRRGLLWDVIPQALSYFSPRFHPEQHANQHLSAAWLEQHQDRYHKVR